ncbi:PadR family transcriptional regulator [Rathayibacter caricis DSM 15933]|jgi:DNA-binding PadR family transcriptional regulator|uniref:PadR family transcriptional regulator n=1 Tax=Rathayibacter caricis DSM 15933 TaxID=1328867 RepID=A0A2T4UYV6_9MICO|nr:PadR family transcriptional regulator [Rathayibacter caricis]PTL74707.1 PadR family transcriptional regulator [Rathayibacter caricis DSM 15933]
MTPPLPPTAFWILTVLSRGRRHGYAILAEARELSSGDAVLKVPTLYSALERLAADGLVAVDGEEVSDGRLRRFFRLTEAGGKALATELARLQVMVEQGSAALRERPEGVVA